MSKEWFSSKELTSLDGLPSTIQGVNRKARIENWKSRKRQGVQGKAIEYHIDSLPSLVKNSLSLRDVSAAYTIPSAAPMQLWLSAFTRLNETEQEIITNWLMRNGVKDLVNFVIEQNKQEES